MIGQELAADLVQHLGRGGHGPNHLQKRGQLEPGFFEGHVGQGFRRHLDLFLVLAVFEHGVWQHHRHADFDLGLSFFNTGIIFFYTTTTF